MNLAFQATLLLAEAAKEGAEFTLNNGKLSIFIPHTIPQELQDRLQSHDGMIKARVEYDAEHPGHDVLNRFLYQHLYEINDIYASPIQGVFQDYQEWTKAHRRQPISFFHLKKFLASRGIQEVIKCEMVCMDNILFYPVSQKVNPWNKYIKTLAEWVLELSPKDLPPAPFEFCQGETIRDSKKYLTAFQNEIRCGENHPRSISGSLQSDVRILWQLLNPDGGGDG